MGRSPAETFWSMIRMWFREMDLRRGPLGKPIRHDDSQIPQRRGYRETLPAERGGTGDVCSLPATAQRAPGDSQAPTAEHRLLVERPLRRSVRLPSKRAGFSVYGIGR